MDILSVTMAIKNIFKHFLNLDSRQLQACDSTEAISNNGSSLTSLLSDTVHF